MDPRVTNGGARMTQLQRFRDALAGYSEVECIASAGESHSYVDLVRQTELWLERFDSLGIQDAAVVGLRADYSLTAIAAVIALVSRRAVAAFIPQAGAVDSYLA